MTRVCPSVCGTTLGFAASATLCHPCLRLLVTRRMARADVERFVSGEDRTGARVVPKAAAGEDGGAAEEGDGGELVERQRKQKAYAA